MRLRRVLLRNYRGVAERDVSFEQDGVTIVVGPNETGKSSLAEALDLIVDHLDSSKRKEVRSVKPVHLDAGAEIEVEITAGEYAFTYFKRFHKKAETRLTVTAPRPESLTGREAHERVQGILAESVDLPLWRALRIQQGSELTQPDLAEGSSLAAALDRAAGQTLAADEAESLFEAARGEFERHFTPTKRERKELGDAREAVAVGESELAAVQANLQRVEADARKSEDLTRRGAELERQVASLVQDAEVKERRWTEVQGEAEKVTRLRLAADAAAARLSEAEQRVAERAGLAGQATEAAQRLDALRARQEEAAAPLRETQEAAAAAAECLAAARALADDARRSAELRTADFEFRRAELDHAQLSERLGRIHAAEEAALAAEESLETNRVDGDAIDAVRDARLEFEKARARLESGSTQLSVEALANVDVRLGGGEAKRLSSGETLDEVVAEELHLTIGDVARVRLTPSRGGGDLAGDVARATAELQRLLDSSGANDVVGAESLHVTWQDATRKLAQRDRVVAENLRDLSRENLERKAEGTGRTAASYLAGRAVEPPPAPDFDSAEAATKSAEEARREADDAVSRARDAHDAAGRRLADQQEGEVEVRAKLTVTESECERHATALTAARKTASDDDLTSRADESRQAAATAGDAAASATAALESVEPDLVQRAAEGARGAVESARKDLRAVEREQIEVGARLEELGQRGLAEREGELASQLERARHELASLERSAAAAKLLFTTLREKREAARRAYVAPLAAAVTKLGRFVFGTDFEVTLGEDLRVESRTLGGRTVPFTDLSGGAREQLSLLLRLAAAQTVAEDGGVPLILDDALGYSDPARLAAMGTVLDQAGRHTQVIVLTCMPERYRHVAGAHVVRFE